MLKSMKYSTILLDGEACERRNRNLEYMMRLENDHLLLSHYIEAGLKSFTYLPDDIHGGWDSPLSQIRGTVVGHWLSSAAHMYAECRNEPLLYKANTIVHEIGRCQSENGGQWMFPIPEKYLYWLQKGKSTWAPQYVCHKNMQGLLDMYAYTGNKEALDIVLHAADWFVEFTKRISDAQMDKMMDLQETGGMMMLWADLYAITKDERHLALMRKYERRSFSEALLRKEDVLTNMHMNALVPEILGCARAYEVSGEERYRHIVEAFWELAVTKRGYFVSGGQSSGEVFTPMHKLSARLSDMTQEHCTVYHMMQLAEYLYRWSGDVIYSDYWERNLYNGIYAQGYLKTSPIFQKKEGLHPQTRLVTYYLPLKAGSVKKWGSEKQDFWCCHNTLMNANAVHHEAIYYQEENAIVVSQYLSSQLQFSLHDTSITLTQKSDLRSNNSFAYVDADSIEHERPHAQIIHMTIHCDQPVHFELKLRKPWWIAGDVHMFINDEEVSVLEQKQYLCIQRLWQNGERLRIVFPSALYCEKLDGMDNTAAFMEGSVVLAGICDHDRLLYGDIKDPYSMLIRDSEREWDAWKIRYRTIHQPIGMNFIPLYLIDEEHYSVYFEVERKK